MGTLDGKAAVVTAGSRGIGRAIVLRLADEGASIVFSYAANKQAADEVVEAASTRGGRVVAVRADQGTMADQERLLTQASETLGGLDILVNNAGIAPTQQIVEVSDADYDRVMAVNAKGPYFAMQYAARQMRDGGRIINISTLSTALPAPGSGLYCASKTALEQFTSVAARELGSRGITVNSVSPGTTDTELLRGENPPGAIDLSIRFIWPRSVAACDGFGNSPPDSRLDVAIHRIARGVPTRCIPESTWSSPPAARNPPQTLGGSANSPSQVRRRASVGPTCCCRIKRWQGSARRPYYAGADERGGG